jgi:hypothetical protein
MQLDGCQEKLAAALAGPASITPVTSSAPLLALLRCALNHELTAGIPAHALGCTDTSAINWDVGAAVNDGTCRYECDAEGATALQMETAPTCHIYDGIAGRWMSGSKTGQETSEVADSTKVVVQGQPTADNGKAAAGGCNYEYISDPLPWEEAMQACTARGGHLASAHSEYDMGVIKELVSATVNAADDAAIWIHDGGRGANGGRVWIGLNDREVRSRPHAAPSSL